MHDHEHDDGEDGAYSDAPGPAVFHGPTPTDESVPLVRRNEGPPVAKRADLAEAWPEVRAWLLDSLRRRLDDETAEDVCQEVAVRVLKAMDKGRAFESTGELARWSYTAAIHRVIDLWRQARRGPVGLPGGSGQAADAAVIVEGRFVLAEVAAAIARLPAPQREALLLDERPPGVDPTSSRHRVRRIRARQYLRAVVHSWPGIVPLGRFRWFRRLAGSLSRLPVASEWGQVVAAVCLSLAIVAPNLVDGKPRSPTSLEADGTLLVRPQAMSPAGAATSVAVAARSSSSEIGQPAASAFETMWRQPTRNEVAAVEGPVAGSAGFTDPPEGEPLACVALQRDQPLCVPSPVGSPSPPELPARVSAP